MLNVWHVLDVTVISLSEREVSGKKKKNPNDLSGINVLPPRDVPTLENKVVNSRLKAFRTPLQLHSRHLRAFQGPLAFQIQKIIFLIDCLVEFVGISHPKKIFSGRILEWGPLAWLHPV